MIVLLVPNTFINIAFKESECVCVCVIISFFYNITYIQTYLYIHILYILTLLYSITSISFNAMNPFSLWTPQTQLPDGGYSSMDRMRQAETQNNCFEFENPN